MAHTQSGNFHRFRQSYQNWVFQVDVRLLISVEDHNRVPQQVLVVDEVVVLVGLVDAVVAVPDGDGGGEGGDEHGGHPDRHVRAVRVPDAETRTAVKKVIVVMNSTRFFL